MIRYMVVYYDGLNDDTRASFFDRRDAAVIYVQNLNDHPRYEAEIYEYLPLAGYKQIFI